MTPDLASWLSANLHLILQGDIDCAEAEAIIGEAIGPEAPFNILRQQQASYAHDHYGDQFDRTCSDAPSGSIRRCQQIAIERLGTHVDVSNQAVLDAGCAVGRTTLDLAANGASLALGIDLNWPLLHIGRQIIDHGRLSYPHRRLGNRYERRNRKVTFPAAQNADFWIADALALPFAADTFGLAFGLNIIDCVADPTAFIMELRRVVAPKGGFALTTPFDWAPHATPYAAWLNDMSALDNLMTTHSHVSANIDKKSFRPTAPSIDLPWSLRLHDRSTISYVVRLVTIAAD